MHSENPQKYKNVMMFMYQTCTRNLIIEYKTATFACINNICNGGLHGDGEYTAQCLRCLNVHGKLSDSEHSSIKKIVMFSTSIVKCYMQTFHVVNVNNYIYEDQKTVGTTETTHRSRVATYFFFTQTNASKTPCTFFNYQIIFL